MYVVDVSIIITLIGVCVTFLITFAQLMEPLTSMPMQNLIICFVVVVYPITLLRNIGRLASFSFVGIVCLLLSVAIIIGYGCLFLGNSTKPSLETSGSLSLSLFPRDFVGLLSYAGTATFCIDICTPGTLFHSDHTFSFSLSPTKFNEKKHTSFPCRRKFASEKRYLSFPIDQPAFCMDHLCTVRRRCRIVV